MVPTIVTMIDKLMPGGKTYALMGLGVLMTVCQMGGWHNFSPEAWGLLGIGGAATWKMGLTDREPATVKKK